MAKNKRKEIFSQEIIDDFRDYNDLMPDIIRTAEDIKSECTDYIIKDVPMANFRIDDNENLKFSNVIQEDMDFQTTSTSISQFCTKLDIPYKNFFRKLRTSENHKQEKVVLTKNLFEELASYYPKEIMVRTYKNIIRAVLSSKYSVYDSDLIAKDIDDCINKHWSTNSLGIKSYINTPEKFQVRIIDKNGIPVDKEKNIYCGLTISSSDIGASKLNVQFYIYQSFDHNGICVMNNTKTDMFTQKHLGIAEEDIQKKIVNALKEFPEVKNNILEFVLYASKKSLAQSGLYNPKSYNGKNMMRELGLTKEDKIKEFMTYVENNPKTLWGYVNSISDYAATIKNFEIRTNLEKIAGRILIHPEQYGIRKEI